MRPHKQFFVYIMSNSPKSTVLYTGMIGELRRRIWQYKNKRTAGFASRYNLDQLVYYDHFVYPDAAINREKEIKGWRRSKKTALIESMNPRWEDLATDWQDVYKPKPTAEAGRSLGPLEKTRAFGMTPQFRCLTLPSTVEILCPWRSTW